MVSGSSSATCGCKLNCDKYTEQCIAWRLKSVLACAQTKLFFTCTSLKWSHFKGAAYFVLCMHCFFLPEEKYLNNKSSPEEVLPCLVISWEVFFYLYIMQILLRHIGNRNWLVLHRRCECKMSVGLGFFLSGLTLQTKWVNRNVCIKFFIRFRAWIYSPHYLQWEICLCVWNTKFQSGFWAVLVYVIRKNFSVVVKSYICFMGETNVGFLSRISSCRMLVRFVRKSNLKDCRFLLRDNLDHITQKNLVTLVKVSRNNSL